MLGGITLITLALTYVDSWQGETMQVDSWSL